MGQVRRFLGPSPRSFPGGKGNGGRPSSMKRFLPVLLLALWLAVPFVPGVPNVLDHARELRGDCRHRRPRARGADGVRRHDLVWPSDVHGVAARISTALLTTGRRAGRRGSTLPVAMLGSGVAALAARRDHACGCPGTIWRSAPSPGRSACITSSATSTCSAATTACQQHSAIDGSAALALTGLARILRRSLDQRWRLCRAAHAATCSTAGSGPGDPGTARRRGARRRASAWTCRGRASWRSSMRPCSPAWPAGCMRTCSAA